MTDVSTTGGSMSREPTRWGFGSPGPLRDELTALAFGGGKVVTSSLLADYEIEGEPVDQPGDIGILLDSADAPVATVEDVLSKVIRLADMTDQDAVDEGEGYADAAAFRLTHERFWNGYIDEVREGIGDPGFTITDDTPIVVERFRIIGILAADGSPITPVVRPAYPPDRPAVDAFLADRNADVVARLGEVVDARRRPALIVEADGVIEGVLTWELSGTSMEVLTLHAARQWSGVGTALIAAARRVAEASGARRLWLITTNDNVDGLRFYQRRGFRLARLHPGAVDRSRETLKPAIPEVGDHGIPLRDELELETLIHQNTPVPDEPD
ncbi:MAG TPA: GNAT family N-acetyltransferase [Candidatus Limnocylindrales bacterium]